MCWQHLRCLQQTVRCWPLLLLLYSLLTRWTPLRLPLYLRCLHFRQRLSRFAMLPLLWCWLLKHCWLRCFQKSLQLLRYPKRRLHCQPHHWHCLRQRPRCRMRRLRNRWHCFLT